MAVVVSAQPGGRVATVGRDREGVLVPDADGFGARGHASIARPRSGPWVAVPLALASQLAGQREPDLGLGGFRLRSSQVLLDVEVGASLRGVDVVL
jgi:hypothetical protein